MHTQLHITQYKIDQHKKDQMVLALTTMMVFFAMVLANIFLPSILFDYVLSRPGMDVNPAFLQYIPVVTFTIAALHFLWTALKSFRSVRQIRVLQKELEILEFTADDSDMHAAMAQDLSYLEEEITVPETTEKPVRKRATKKVATKKKSKKA